MTCKSRKTPEHVNDKVLKIENPTGEKIVLSKADGGIKESALTAEDVNNRIPKILSPTGNKLVLSNADGEEKESGLTVNDVTNKASKIKNSTGGKIVLYNADGEVKESTLTVGDITVKASKIPAPTGEKIVLSNADGEKKESALTVDDVRLLRLKNSLENERFINNQKRLLKMDMRVKYNTTLTTFMFDSKVRFRWKQAIKKLRVVFTTGAGGNYHTAKEWTMEANENNKEFNYEISLTPGMLYNFEMEVENATNLSDVFDFLRLEWYYTEG